MQRVAKSKFFLTGISSVLDSAEMQKTASRERFYQQILLRLGKKDLAVESFKWLCRLAEQAITLRLSDTVEEVADLLLNTPFPIERKVGQYYKAFCVKRRGDFSLARKMFEQIIESPLTPPEYKAQALQSIGAIYYESGNPVEALRFYLDAARASSLNENGNLITGIMAHSMIAVVKSSIGNHQGALRDLDGISPIIRSVAKSYPFFYFCHANSLAVELGEVGRVEEALNASRIALASPFASAYPEWRETGDELKMRERRSSHNFVAFNAGFNQRSSDTGNVVTLPVSAHINSAEPVKAGYNPFQQPARIIDFQSWKRTMSKESNDTPKDEKLTKEMTTREMLLKLIGLISEKDLTDDQLERMLEAVESIACESQTRDRQ